METPPAVPWSAPCPGSGWSWRNPGSPACSVCQRSWKSLGLTRRPRRRKGKYRVPVPAHERTRQW